MIKLESVHIEEVRGIRKLDLDLQKEKFAISGPNGSGKSGVIDAIEFGLTGRISRLTGPGTGGLSIAEHGPHVDMTKFPDAAFVTLKVHLTGLGKSATITRKVNAPKSPQIDPPDADIKAVLAEVAEHPEIALSRREILRFILVEPTKRSEEIQTILKLDQIGQTRAALNSAQNKLQTAYKNATAKAGTDREALQRHLQIPTLSAKDLLATVNSRRRMLDLAEISELTPDTKLDEGLSNAAKGSDFNKVSALADVRALEELLAQLPGLAASEAQAIVTDLAALEADPALRTALQRRAFINKGLELVNGPACPLCDTAWPDEAHLREHFKTKLAKSETARVIGERLVANGTAISAGATRVVGVLTSVQKVALLQDDVASAQAVSTWRGEIEAIKPGLVTVDGLTLLKERLAKSWSEAPEAIGEKVSTLRDKIASRPDQSAAIAAQTFLTTAQLRLNDWRESQRKNKAAELAAKAAKKAYDTYCAVLEEELNALYKEVEKDFSSFYRTINEDDEAKFTAQLTPSEGKVSLDVNFYERGLFPPGAYHSEGHQDGMGVCLYLALMKRLFGERFTFALLDDVVMSVDADHRYQFCKLLKTAFPDTQFVITTHDRLWAEQMRSAGLVTSKTSIAFHSWTIDTGPLVESNQAIWEEISGALEKGKVEAAAGALRRHLEYAARHLANELGATPQFRSDGNYELGELLPSVLSRMKDIYGKAAAAAQSWGKDSEKESVSQRKAALSASNGASSVEQWAVNKAVHHNAWANFGKKDFGPVVAAFKELLGLFTCSECDSWLYVSPRANPETLRCACNAVSLNLKLKPK